MTVTIYFKFNKICKILLFENTQISMVELLENVSKCYDIPYHEIGISFGEISYNHNTVQNLTIASSGLLNYLLRTIHVFREEPTVFTEPSISREPTIQLKNIIENIVHKKYDKENILLNSLILIDKEAKSKDYKPPCVILDYISKQNIGDSILLGPNEYISFVATEQLPDGNGVLFTSQSFSFKCADSIHKAELKTEKALYAKNVENAEAELCRKRDELDAADRHLEELESLIEENNNDYSESLHKQIGEAYVVKKQATNRWAICKKIRDDLSAKKLSDMDSNNVDPNKTITIQTTLQMKLKYGRYTMSNGQEICILPITSEKINEDNIHFTNHDE